MLIQHLREDCAIPFLSEKMKERERERKKEEKEKREKRERRQSVKLFHNGLSSKLFLHQILSLSLSFSPFLPIFLSLPLFSSFFLSYSLTQTLSLLKDGFYGWKKDSRRMSVHLTPTLSFLLLLLFFPFFSLISSSSSLFSLVSSSSSLFSLVSSLSLSHFLYERNEFGNEWKEFERFTHTSFNDRFRTEILMVSNYRKRERKKMKDRKNERKKEKERKREK